MALLIGYGSPVRRALAQLEPWPDTSPEDCGFWLPNEAKSGDRVLWYIGGNLRQYVALGRTTSGWSKRLRGDWRGVSGMGTSKPRLLAPFVSAEAVAHACGLPVPRDAGVVPKHLERQVLAFVQGKPVDAGARALEGGMTEARSRQRNQRLRNQAITLADGVCSCCGTDFKKVAGGLGQRCLVVHHTRQIRDYDTPEETRLSDLTVVCANCHMLIHSDPNKALSVAQARSRLRAGRRRA